MPCKSSNALFSVPRGEASDRSIAEILSSLQSGTSKKHLLYAFHWKRKSFITKYTTTLSLPSVDDPAKQVKFSVLNIAAWLRHVVLTYKSLADALERILKDKPHDYILKLAIYYDEVVPGNVLLLQSRRKFMAQYFSFLEMAGDLRTEAAWFTFGTILTKSMKEVLGGYSAILRAQLEQQFAPLMDGVCLTFPTIGSRIVRASVAIHIGDFDALRKGFDMKGAAGTLFCLKCKNCIQGSEPRDGYLQPLSCPYIRKMDIRTDLDMWNTADSLDRKRPRMTNVDFKIEQQCLGANYSPYGVLWSSMLRGTFGPISTLRYDPMHIYFSNGIASQEILFLMVALGTQNVSWAQVGEWLGSKIKVRKSLSGTLGLTALFSKEHQKASQKAHSFKGTASQCLSLVPLLAHFILVAVPESARRRLQLTCDSFAALADVCNLLQQCKAHGAGRLAPELRAKTEEHFVLFNKAYGVAWCKPKRHLTLHIPDQVEQDNTLYDCFPLERKNKKLKLAGKHVFCNGVTFQSSTLFRATRLHCLELAQPFGDHLIGDTADIGHAVFARSARIDSRTLTRGDMVRWSSGVGCIEGAWLVGGAHVFSVSVYERDNHLYRNTFIRRFLKPGDDMVSAPFWYDVGSSVFVG